MAIRDSLPTSALAFEVERPRAADLGVRMTYLWSEPVTEKSAPYCDIAVPFAWPLATTRS